MGPIPVNIPGHIRWGSEQPAVFVDVPLTAGRLALTTFKGLKLFNSIIQSYDYMTILWMKHTIHVAPSAGTKGSGA